MAVLSVVIPAFNEEPVLEKAAFEVGAVLSDHSIDYELIFVDDGSKDGTWDIINRLSSSDGRIRGLRFSRNFGKEAAIFAGLAQVRGDCAAVMDCDLQHPPGILAEMFEMWRDGYEIVEGVKRSRGKESVFHRFCAGTFYKIMSKATGLDMARASDFKLLDRRAVSALLTMPERATFFRAMSSWVGFKTGSVEYDVRERQAGETKWSLSSLIRYAISNIASYSAMPLKIVAWIGGFVFLLTFVMGIQTLIKYLAGHALEGFTTVILLLLFLGSVIMMSLGIIGYYISRIYDEIKSRPRYIISEMTWVNGQEP